MKSPWPFYTGTVPKGLWEAVEWCEGTAQSGDAD